MSSARFNTYLRGLLGLLDAKVEGKAPSVFLDELRLTLNALPFLYAQRRTVLVGATDNVTLGGWWPSSGNAIRVPPGEVWYVEHANVIFGHSVPLVAGDHIAASPAYQTRTDVLGLLTEIAMENSVYGEFGGVTSPSFTASRPFLMLPGDVYGAWVNDCTPAAGNVGTGSLRLAYIPMSV